MKVALFCGGQGMRMRDMQDPLPKPMALIGYRPILWHLMKYYSHFGHNDFVLCLGYRADVIKEYFLKYNECLSNDFVLSKGCKQVDLLSRDIDDWRITFSDTGVNANVGQRLLHSKQFLGDDEMFMANYADGLSDIDLAAITEDFKKRDRVACFVRVSPMSSLHVAAVDTDGTVTEVRAVNQSGFRVNGGFFIFRRQIFDYLEEGEELVEAPFQRLIKARQLLAYDHDGFWACMDTFKEKQQLELLEEQGNAPWRVWGKE